MVRIVRSMRVHNSEHFSWIETNPENPRRLWPDSATNRLRFFISQFLFASYAVMCLNNEFLCLSFLLVAFLIFSFYIGALYLCCMKSQIHLQNHADMYVDLWLFVLVYVVYLLTTQFRIDLSISLSTHLPYMSIYVLLAPFILFCRLDLSSMHLCTDLHTNAISTPHTLTPKYLCHVWMILLVL